MNFCQQTWEAYPNPPPISVYIYIYIFIYIYRVNNCFRFQDTNFYFKPFEKGGFNFFYLMYCLGRFVKQIASKVVIKMLGYF